MSKKPVLYNKETETFVFDCPHCDAQIHVSEKQTNCCIFRHAAMKKNLTQINPHTPKIQCDLLVENGLIWGCGKPFKFHKAKDGNEAYVDVCEYI